MRGLARAVLLAVALAPLPALAQETATPPPVLTIDQERLFSETQYGKRVQAKIGAASDALSAENHRIESELTAEEKRLTEKRDTLPPAEFRDLADAFDDKVVARRRAQDAKTRRIAEMRETGRKRFFERILPVLAKLVQDRGAVAILDKRAVLLSAERVDITDAAIDRIDARLGDGGDLDGLGPGALDGAEPPSAGRPVDGAEGPKLAPSGAE